MIPRSLPKCGVVSYIGSGKMWKLGIFFTDFEAPWGVKFTPTLNVTMPMCWRPWKGTRWYKFHVHISNGFGVTCCNKNIWRRWWKLWLLLLGMSWWKRLIFKLPYFRGFSRYRLEILKQPSSCVEVYLNQIWWPSATRGVRYGGQCAVLGQWDGRVIPT